MLKLLAQLITSHLVSGYIDNQAAAQFADPSFSSNAIDPAGQSATLCGSKVLGFSELFTVLFTLRQW
jgi:hypothetical protein